MANRLTVRLVVDTEGKQTDNKVRLGYGRQTD